jgi:hypothetical protein
MVDGGPKRISELEKAVLQRRKVMDDPDFPEDDDEEDKVKTLTKTFVKMKIKPSSEEPSLNTM